MTFSKDLFDQKSSYVKMFSHFKCLAVTDSIFSYLKTVTINCKRLMRNIICKTTLLVKLIFVESHYESS